MLSKIPTAYPAHVKRLIEITETAMAAESYSSILIHSGKPKLVFLDDYHGPFKANPHFMWWLPLTQSPHCYLLIQTDKKPALFYHFADDFWHVPAQAPSGFWCEHFDIHLCANLLQTEQALKQYQQTSNRRAWIGEDIELGRELGIENINPHGLMQRLHFARAIKTDYEIACLRQANVIALQGHTAAKTAFMAGNSEFETQLAYLAAVQQDQTEMPYRNIIGFGQHASVLHYQYYTYKKQDLNQMQSFLIDAGAQCLGYAADITRCHSRGSQLYQDLIDAMTSAQLRLCQAVKPGVNFVDLHLRMHSLVLDMLMHFGLVNGSREELENSHISGAFFPHGLGHLLGLQVHDIGGWQQDELGSIQKPPSEHGFLRCTRTLAKNMVVTIEPGLYVIDSLLQKWRHKGFAHLLNDQAIDLLRPFGGVRIEDNIVVADIPINLSNS